MYCMQLSELRKKGFRACECLVFDTDCVACLHRRNETGKFFLPLIANMLFVSMRKGWKRYFGGFVDLS